MSKPQGPIDVQTHFLPSAITEVLAERHERPRIVEGEQGRMVEYGEGAAYPLLEEMVKIERKLEHMNEAGLRMSVLSLNIPGLDGLEPADAVSVARDVNAELAALSRAHPDRLAAVAALPMQAPEAAAEELERAVGDGLKGSILYSNAGGRHLDEPDFRPLFETADRLDVPMLMHPTYPLSAPSLQAYALVPVIGFLFDTTTATIRLILDGLFQRHPDFKLIVGHAGSVIPYIVGRIDYESSRIPGGLGSLEVLPSEHIKKLYVDTVTAWQPSLSMVIDYLGADRVLYATDHPFWDPKRTADTMAQAELSDAERAAIEVGNAERLLGLGG